VFRGKAIPRAARLLRSFFQLGLNDILEPHVTEGGSALRGCDLKIVEHIPLAVAPRRAYLVI
jgi:hypothetical protein